MTDRDLKLDFVFGHGRLPDGTAAAKLPGLSIDNALFNLVLMNRIALNYGGGVKMVRTGLYNTVGLYSIVSNNEGKSTRFHFFGIELGAAKAYAEAVELDFKPSLGNIIFSNNIIGSHYAGIFFGAGSAYNDVFDNVIMKSTKWVIESVILQLNSVINNLTIHQSRNIKRCIFNAIDNK